MRRLLALLLLCPSLCTAQTPVASSPVATSGVDPGSAGRLEEIQELRAELARVSARLDRLERDEPSSPVISARADAGQPGGAQAAAQETTSPRPLAGNEQQETLNAATALSSSGALVASSQPERTSGLPGTLPGGATLNYEFDGYYEFNFNRPPGRVNDLRAYDVLSNVISINQADLIFSLEPDLGKGRRYGLRLDFQFGQATDTLQGNPANEPRPDVYRNIFQAYGTYVVPVGRGIHVDVGKWASSLGIEGNYTKDQLNYTRSFSFYFLPFYHTGARVSYSPNSKFTANYWVVNGTNQSEPTNGFKDEMFGFVLSPTKTISWTSNYYLGQEHPDSASASNCTVPVQPGLCVTALNPAANGKLHIFDDYVTWQPKPRLTLAVEGDYVIQREWAQSAPGESSAPSHVTGGAGYVQYQVTPRAAVASRAEYFSDRGGMFSARTQALKEFTGTYKYRLAEGLDTFLEFRSDWTNIPYFTTHTSNAPSGHQNTVTLGLVWWYGGKQGVW